MPYITQERRKELQVTPEPMRNAGELNFTITTLLVQYLEYNKGYQAYNDCLGVLEGAKLELYRRLVAPYEDHKIKENGDVY